MEGFVFIRVCVQGEGREERQKEIDTVIGANLLEICLKMSSISSEPISCYNALSFLNSFASLPSNVFFSECSSPESPSLPFHGTASNWPGGCVLCICYDLLKEIPAGWLALNPSILH